VRNLNAQRKKIQSFFDSHWQDLVIPAEKNTTEEDKFCNDFMMGIRLFVAARIYETYAALIA